ncbi:hypothetical protein PUN28_020836 [Cardiocondyla obscurior]|uniref:Uncharacterized protein n=1 Tax=Cardiocondyla obscurior TaxID=286306 RepID=A0AAW2E664_9HYME
MGVGIWSRSRIGVWKKELMIDVKEIKFEDLSAGCPAERRKLQRETPDGSAHPEDLCRPKCLGTPAVSGRGDDRASGAPEVPRNLKLCFALGAPKTAELSPGTPRFDSKAHESENIREASEAPKA